MTRTAREDRLEMGLMLLLALASGVAALIYEVLWLKELGRLFGVTAHAAATTLAVFFVGLSVGGLVWGRRSSRLARPLRTYAGLELATALSALLYFGILAAYRALYSPLFEAFGGRPGLLLLAKLLLAFGILFPPAFFMGGTLPVLGQHVIRRSGQLGLRASLLYAANTVGAAAGALVAGFFLPATLGFTRAYLVAISLNVLVAAAAFAWGHRVHAVTDVGDEYPPPVLEERECPLDVGVRSTLVWLTAVVSGFATLGLEVLWVRMFGQVLPNSVYSFAAILTVFLVALALGSWLAHLLCRRSWAPGAVLFGLLTLSGILVGLTPWVFYRMTSGLEAVGGAAGWSSHVLGVFVHVVAVILVPGVVIGSVFPYLMKLAEGWTDGPGKTMGQLAAANTGAAIVGSLVAGFVLLDSLGLWASIRLMAVAYLALAVVALPGGWKAKPILGLVPAAGIVLFGAVLTWSGFAAVQAAPGESVLQVWEGSDGTVAVVRRGDDLRMKYNNSYTLGSSAAARLHRRHAWIPLGLHANPRTLFHLGMGTGISSGAALDFPVRRVAVSEISPGIVDAARTHFTPHLNGLFEDPRVEMLHEDGRTFLFGTRRSYDVIVADLFLPWKAGTGSLYSKEHFETVRARLAPGGLFAQWLPMAQVSERELGIIARTMLEVFPQVTVWRRGFSLETPALALIGQRETRPLENEALERHMGDLRRRGRIPESSWLAQMPQAGYAGSLTAARSLFASDPLNTDDRPLVEYLAPVSHQEAVGASPGATAVLSDLYARLFETLPPENDPHLAGLSEQEIGRVLAGRALWDHVVARHAGRSVEARRHLERFQQLSGMPAHVAR